MFLLLRKGLFHLKLLYSTNPFGLTESRRQSIRIIRIVIVGVAVVVDITEIVAVVVISRTTSDIQKHTQE